MVGMDTERRMSNESNIVWELFYRCLVEVFDRCLVVVTCLVPVNGPNPGVPFPPQRLPDSSGVFLENKEFKDVLWKLMRTSTRSSLAVYVTCDVQVCTLPVTSRCAMWP